MSEEYQEMRETMRNGRFAWESREMRESVRAWELASLHRGARLERVHNTLSGTQPCSVMNSTVDTVCGAFPWKYSSFSMIPDTHQRLGALLWSIICSHYRVWIIHDNHNQFKQYRWHHNTIDPTIWYAHRKLLIKFMKNKAEKRGVHMLV